MEWILVNRRWVAGIGFVLLMVIGAGSLLYEAHRKNAVISAELERVVEGVNRVKAGRPSATDQNVELAKLEQDRLARVVRSNRTHFASFGRADSLDSSEFKYLLTMTLHELDRLADQRGVKRPKSFGYTFEKQLNSVVFERGDIEQWAPQLMEIEALCGMLYEARIHSLVALRRASVSTNESSKAVLRGLVPETNYVTRTILTPYEVVFEGFSGELARVLDQVEHSTNCFLIKNLNVERPDRNVGAENQPGRLATLNGRAIVPVVYPRPADPGSAARQDRYRDPDGKKPSLRPVPRPVPTPYASTTLKRYPETVLDESLLRFTMRLTATRPLEEP